MSEPVTYVLFSSFALLPSFVSLVVGHFGSETGHIIVAVFGIPLHSALLTSVAKLLVLVFPLTRGASKRNYLIRFKPTPELFIWHLYLTG